MGTISIAVYTTSMGVALVRTATDFWPFGCRIVSGTEHCAHLPLRSFELTHSVRDEDTAGEAALHTATERVLAAAGISRSFMAGTSAEPVSG